ncbi:expressed unknown protein [Seminavis robusta]|uniref:Glycosyltransferase 61 catalytic domain-containing protein n=1 Tax=Seminavis robusta TaxID=568900 RepID=A0A9N8HKJ5_9STRA|nr:expressed unknown protein [Seminavis robusta]|eukprot:Sro845_g209980.1 n/a (370) ;mRNA; f:11960-13069
MYPRVYPLQDMFLGTAAPHVKNRTDNRLVFPAGPGSQTQAICKWISSNLHEHFPHIMQELLRCFSWWQANQQQTPVLVLDDKELKQEYARDFVGVLEKSFGVQVVKNRLFLPNKTDSNFVYTDVNIYSQPPHLVERAWFQIHNLQDAALLRKETLKLAKENKERDDRNLAEATTNELLGGCPGEGGPLSASKKQPVIAFLNRNGDRHVENIGDILEALKKTKVLGHTLGILDIHYISSFDQLSFWEQVDVMSKVDIVIGPHGAQFTSVAFLPACGGLFELFPKGYYYPNYFGSLARTTGHYHFHLYTGGMNIDAELNQDMMTLEGRMEARSRHVIANVDLVLQGVQQLAERWQSCCERRLQGGTVESLF